MRTVVEEKKKFDNPNEHSSPYPPLSILTITRGTRVTMREIAYFSPGGGEIRESIARNLPSLGNSVEKSSVVIEIFFLE